MAAAHGKTLRQFFTDAIRDKVRSYNDQASPKPWMKHFGALRKYADEMESINRIIESEFEIINMDDWK